MISVLFPADTFSAEHSISNLADIGNYIFVEKIKKKNAAETPARTLFSK